jgi:membrane associated rhomboid family serine protease
MIRPGGFSVLPEITKNLLIINGLGFLATLAFQYGLGISLVKNLGLYLPGSANFAPYQVVTHLFMHGSLIHIFFNMFALFMFGSVLEQVLGAQRFFTYYFVAGFGAAALYMGVNYLEALTVQQDLMAAGVSKSNLIALQKATTETELRSVLGSIDQLSAEVRENVISLYRSYNIPTVGASGAVYGLLAGFGLLFPNTNIYLYFLFPIKAKYLVIGAGAIELYSQLTAGQGDNIAHLAHLGGMLFGFLLLRVWGIQRFN